MAVTVLKNLKESKQGNPAQHLKNAVKYILNEEKTDAGLWVGGNCGLTANEIYNRMIETKKIFGKPEGRQGYHFVISFRPGECDEATAYAVAKDFCEEYLRYYDYCFAIHNDHPHMHCHIIFNSVDHVEGLKYRYVKGDWGKYIQPITDRICKKYGLSELVYERGEHIGKSYSEHMAEKDDRMTWKQIVRYDIDYAIALSNSEEEFISCLKKMGYKIRRGYSRKKESPYWAFTPPGAKKAFRNYTLGPGYSYVEILSGLDRSTIEFENKIVFPIRQVSLIAITNRMSLFQAKTVSRYNQASCYHFMDLLLREQARVRKDLIRIDQISEECEYILSNNIRTVDELKLRFSIIQRECGNLRRRIKDHDEMQQNLDTETELMIKSHEQLLRKQKNPELSEAEFERVSDEIESMEEEFPEIFLNDDIEKLKTEYDNKNYERKILLRILRSYGLTEETRTIPVPPEVMKASALRKRSVKESGQQDKKAKETDHSSKEDNREALEKDGKEIYRQRGTTHKRSR